MGLIAKRASRSRDGYRQGGLIDFAIRRRLELLRWSSGDLTALAPATGLIGKLFPPERTLPTDNRIPTPEGGNGRKPFAGQED